MLTCIIPYYTPARTRPLFILFFFHISIQFFFFICRLPSVQLIYQSKEAANHICATHVRKKTEKRKALLWVNHFPNVKDRQIMCGTRSFSQSMIVRREEGERICAATQRNNIWIVNRQAQQYIWTWCTRFGWLWMNIYYSKNFNISLD